MMTDLILRFIAGGTLISIISLISKTKYSFLAGIMMLFPAVTLVGYYFVSKSVDATTLKNITLYGMYGIPTTFIFLLAFYFLQARYNILQALTYSVMAWGLTAVIITNIVKVN